MSTQLRYVQSYAQMVQGYLDAYPEDEAVARAVGGEYERFGVLEHALLRQFGLREDSRVVDVGCGAGRLTSQLARLPGVRYLGLDVVPALLAYTRRRVPREDFRLELTAGNAIPGEDGSADFVTFFSVFTHLLHEESYVYLAEAHRVLAPGGRAFFSFLEFHLDEHWSVFDGNVDWVRRRSYLGHINVFMHPQDLRRWAARLGFEVVAIRHGNAPFIEVPAALATEKAPAGKHPFGQSVCVLGKPAQS
ncbi:MAG TPA: class I SAM-dependent methyltransferase [Crenalkalicoccus sp.]|nr:class I SAM-dependent methyltransferase [Crenalkalicoccus sp.]